MRNYIYKVMIAAIGLIVVFEFTIGRKFDEINKINDQILTRQNNKDKTRTAR